MFVIQVIILFQFVVHLPMGLESVKEIVDDKFCRTLIPTLSQQISYNTIAINGKLIKELALTDVKCCIWQISTLYKELMTNVKSKRCYKFTESTNNQITITNYHLIEVQCDGVSRLYGKIIDRNVFYLPQKHMTQHTLIQHMRAKLTNVLILAIDGMSAEEFQENAVNAHSFLEKISATEMLSFKLTENNAYSNLIALLTGDEECTDKCEFIWEKFKRLGYITAFGEDTSENGLFDRTAFNGSFNFDYRTFDLYASQHIGHKMRSNGNMCLGNELRFKRLLKNIAMFANTYSNRPYFAFFWGTSYGTEFSGVPNNFDTQLMQLFNYMKLTRSFRKTIFIFLSSDTRQSTDASEPFLYIFLPNLNYYDMSRTLKEKNNQALGPQDIYATLIHIFNITESVSEKGQSLFRKN